MKEIFIGSSKEALEQATQVVAVLSEVPDVKPLLWTDYFKLGDITFLGIENIAQRVAGAVFLATPDDDSIIREQRVKIPRANVLFEYGYLTAMLTRGRVALCRYDGAELPSDFAGVYYVPMGTFEPTRLLDHQARARLKSWATELPTTQVGFSPTCQMHGYSGSWQTETVYEVYRNMQLKHPDYAVLNGKMILQISANGDGGFGCLFGNLQIQVGDCYAEFEVTDRVIDAKVFGDGSMKIRNTVQSRQRIRLEGNPPQRDGFEPDFRGAREIDLLFNCPPDEPGVLRGRFSSEAGGIIYSKGIGKWYR
ncbi:MAG TPA: nucleotide-binding protein [Blastocatellia bacterium]|nr:nucleotide-binding protein [Blastocatellia bacterium]